MSYESLSYYQVGFAALLILINALISIVLKLNLGRLILIAALRTIVQLLLIGLILTRVFEVKSWAWVVALMSIMTLIAGYSSVQRIKYGYRGIWWSGLVSMAVSSWLTTGLTLVAIVQVRPWYSPQYAIPLLGMVLGNTLNGISLGMDRFGESLESRRGEVEMLLTLGASRWEAAHELIAEAVRTGMIPILNAMMVVGIVSLPGMMTGQLLAGVSPIEAVKYQVVIMFVIASATALGTLLAVIMSFRARFSPWHRIR